RIGTARRTAAEIDGRVVQLPGDENVPVRSNRRRIDTRGTAREHVREKERAVRRVLRDESPRATRKSGVLTQADDRSVRVGRRDDDIAVVIEDERREKGPRTRIV